MNNKHTTHVTNRHETTNTQPEPTLYQQKKPTKQSQQTKPPHRQATLSLSLLKNYQKSPSGGLPQQRGV